MNAKFFIVSLQQLPFFAVLMGDQVTLQQYLMYIFHNHPRSWAPWWIVNLF